MFLINKGSSKIMIYFHGNAEDMGTASAMMGKLGQSLQCHTICIEYPGYGVCCFEPK